MNDTQNRRSRRAAAATAPVAAAIDAAADRASIESDPSIEAAAPPAVDAPIVPGAEIADNATVLPEPTLVAEPDKPMPIVTASPILAVEPTAMDVVKADAAADRVAAGIEQPADAPGLHSAAAGQPTLTIEGDTVSGAMKRAISDGVIGGLSQAGSDVLARGDADAAGRRYGFGDGMSTGPETYADGDIVGFVREMMEIRDNNPERFGRIFFDATGESWPALGEHRTPSLDEVLRGLEHLVLVDPIGVDIIRTRFFAEPARAFGDGVVDHTARPDAPTVTVIEVVGPEKGRRRAGRSFGSQAQRFLSGELSDAEIDALRADPLLAVGINEVEADAFGMPIAGR